MAEILNVLLYSERDNEIDEYARLVDRANLPIKMTVCRTPDEVAADIDKAEIIFGVHLPAELYIIADKLRWIQSMWAGVEGLLTSPVPADVIITKPWGTFGKYLSQYVFAYLLADRMKVATGVELQKAASWQPYRVECLAGQRLGIAGMGDIGSEIAGIARAFGMSVYGLNRDGRANAAAEKMFPLVQLKEFAAEVDVLIVVMPSTPETRGLFSREVLAGMRPHALLINIGRGALIDDEALVEALETGRLRGAVLDVFQQEPLPPEHPYWRLPNCTVTPHIGGPSLPEDITNCFLENFRRFETGQPLMGLVNRERGY